VRSQSTFFGVQKAAQFGGVSLVALAGVAGAAPDAVAQDRFFYRDPYFQRFDAPPPPSRLDARRPDPRSRLAPRQPVKPPEKVKEAPPPAGPHMLIVSVKSQNVSFYANGKLVSQSPVSTGTATNPTPHGVFSVIQRNRHHRSNIYSGAPMPYMQRLTWSGIALHQGALPGYPASHGCIRLPEHYANYLWRTIKMNTRVIVSREDVAPTDIAHALLFQPKPASATVQSVPELRKTFDTTTSERVRTASTAVIATDGAGERVDGEDAKPAMRDLTTSVEHLNAKDGAQTGIKADIAAPAQPDEPAKSDPAKVEIAAPLPADMPLKPELAGQEPSKDEAKPDATASIYPRPADIPEPILASFTQSLDAKQKKAAPSGAVTVFISKKEKRLYVRQHFIPLFSAPVTFKDDKANFGTHVFSALEKDGSDKELRWVAITMPPELPKTGKVKTRIEFDRRGRPIEVPVKPQGKAPEPVQSLSAAAVLNQIEIAPEVIDRISEYVAPGASLIVSDHGLGSETGLYTDFIVVTQK
jgi:methionine-rich copper-binding protein CopC